MQTITALDLSFDVGKALLENGAEISRVQETMERIAAAYDAEDFHVYVLTNAIFSSGTVNGVPQNTKLRFVPDSTIHMGRISALNQLSREIVSGQHTVEDAHAKLEQIRRLPFARLSVSAICCAVGSACYTFLFNGSAADIAAAFLCGLILESYLYLIGKTRAPISKFIVYLSASGIAALTAVLFVLVGIGANPDKIITGSIIRLVPGVSLTTSIRDFFNGDYLSGSIRMTDAVITGCCMGIGVGVVMKLMSFFMGGVWY